MGRLAQARAIYRARRFGSFRTLHAADPALGSPATGEFYAKSLAVYQALRRRIGAGQGERVFEFALDVEQAGLDVALRRLGLSVGEFHAAIRDWLESDANQ